MTTRLSLYDSYRHALAACDGRFIAASLTLAGYRIESAVGLVPVIGVGATYEQALEDSIWKLDRHASLWEVAA